MPRMGQLDGSEANPNRTGEMQSMKETPVLTGQVAIVTGAGRGIGAAIARKLASLGAKTVLCGRTSAPLAAVARQITDDGGHALPVPVDVSDLRSVDSLVAQVQSAFGRANVLINNAGIGGFGGPL